MAILLENDLFRLAFDQERLRIVSLCNKATGDEHLKRDIETPLCLLACLHDGEGVRREFVPQGPCRAQVRPTAGGQALEVAFEGVSDGERTLPIALRATIELGAGRAEAEWRLEVDNRAAGWQVVEVLYPYLRGLYLGHDWQDDILIYPHHAGERTVAPIREYTSDRYLHFGRAQTHRQGDLYWREIPYCGLASMMWLYYYDQANGLYLASHDDDFRLTGLRVETAGPADPWIGFGLRKYHRIRPGEAWSSKPSIVALTQDDWHWGARRYRAWFRTHVVAAPNPALLHDEFTLNQCYQFKREGGTIYHRFDDIPALYEAGRREFQARHIFIASWNRGGFDWDYPEYHPDMELGSPVDLASACREVRSRGGLVTFYINARIFDTASDYYPTLGRRWAIKGADGSLRLEKYGPRTFSVSCPAHSEWQKWIGDIATWMVEAYGATGIYLDQLGSAEPFPCYDPDHTHLDIGEFNAGYLALLRSLRARLQQLNPNSFLMIENCGDIYSAWVWGNLTWNGEPYDEFFNLYKYTFPEYVQVNMVNPRPQLAGEERQRRFHQDMERAMLLGSVFWLGLDKFSDGDEAAHRYMQRAVAMRAELQPLLRQATYLDDDGVYEVPEGIRASHWALAGDGHLYILANHSPARERYLDVAAPAAGARRVVTGNIDRVPEKLQAAPQGSRVRIRVPAHSLSWVLLLP